MERLAVQARLLVVTLERPGAAAGSGGFGNSLSSNVTGAAIGGAVADGISGSVPSEAGEPV